MTEYEYLQVQNLAKLRAAKDLIWNASAGEAGDYGFTDNERIEISSRLTRVIERLEAMAGRAMEKGLSGK